MKVKCEECGAEVKAEYSDVGIGCVHHYYHCGWNREVGPNTVIVEDKYHRNVLTGSGMKANIENVIAELVLSDSSFHPIHREESTNYEQANYEKPSGKKKRCKDPRNNSWQNNKRGKK